MTALSELTISDGLQDWSRETAPRADGSVSLIIADSHHCRWPVGQMHFCGKPKLMGKSYCEQHNRMAYVTGGA